MSFDNQKKILSKNNPIDFIEEYVLNYEIEKVRDSRDEIIIFSKVFGEIMIFLLNGTVKEK